MEYISTGLLLIILALVLKNSLDSENSLVKKKKAPIILDSCALIDGRVIELAKTGFIDGEIVIPQFIVSELQTIADGNDSHKRSRARFGLDMVTELQNLSTKVRLATDPIKEKRQVDDKLISLAKKINGRLFTTDFNLNKVAQIEGVTVLNVNELAQSLRPIVLPGETTEIKIIQKGSNKRQGVGYLDDGTMVVVENAANKQGKTVKVEFSRSLQTVAGKMVFADLVQSKRIPRGKPKAR